MDVLAMLKDSAFTAGKMILKMAYIIVPIIIVIECLKDSGLLEKFSKRMQKLTKLFGLPGEASLGMTVGLLIGLIFGSGVIIKTREYANLDKRQLNTLLILVGISHALIEETVYFTSLGANIFLLVLCRVGLGISFSLIYMYISKKVNKYVKL